MEFASLIAEFGVHYGVWGDKLNPSFDFVSGQFYMAKNFVFFVLFVVGFSLGTSPRLRRR